MYAGDVTPAQAHAAVLAGTGVLVDVRTKAEWSYDGVPDVPALFVEWQSFPDGARNDAFVDDLRAAGVTPGQPIYLLCRSGVRSLAAAQTLTAAGLGPAYNILEGFEGPHDAHGHRAVSGWKNSGLPWKQG